MGNWGELFKVLALVLGWWLEQNSTAKKQKAEALAKIIKGVDEDDPSSINAGFDELNR